MIIVEVIAAVLILAALSVFLVYKLCFARGTNVKKIHSSRPGDDYENRKNEIVALISELQKKDCEGIHIESFDGTRLYGRYYHVADGAPVLIMFHGYKASAERDMCVAHKLATEAGNNVLLVDQRTHGKSEGKMITFGIKERYDCLKWTEYVYERFGWSVPIFLCGLSMGASTVLMASNLALPSSVVGIIADCPYSAPADIIKKVGEKNHIPWPLLCPIVFLTTRMIGRFSLNEASALEAVEEAHIPILLIHGESDSFVPFEMGRKIYYANPDYVTFRSFPGADHGLSYFSDPGRYRHVLKKFLQTTV